jgi:hypothetical protein
VININKDRLTNFKSYKNPFPLLIFENFLTENEAKEAVKIIKSQNFDEEVNSGRKNIRKGSKNFNKILDDNNVLSKIYSFFNQKDVYEDLLLKLEKVSLLSENNYFITNKPNKFKANFYAYKRSVHKNNLLKKLLNFVQNKFNYGENFKNNFFFEINYAMAKKGYKLKLHRDKDNRLIVFLLYLNKLDEAGGNFEIYSQKQISKNFKNTYEYILDKKIKPSPGKLIAFLSNPISYHNVDELLDPNSERYFCYGGYTSLNNIIWKKKE